MLIKESESKSASSAEAWHPDFLGNLDLPEAERAGFNVRALSGREIERIKREKRTKLASKTAGKSARATAKAEAAVGEAIVDAIIDAAVVGLFGWKLERENGTVEEVTDWRKLRDVLLAKPSLGLAPVQMFDALFVRVTGGAELGEKLESE